MLKSAHSPHVGQIALLYACSRKKVVIKSLSSSGGENCGLFNLGAPSKYIYFHSFLMQRRNQRVHSIQMVNKKHLPLSFGVLDFELRYATGLHFLFVHSIQEIQSTSCTGYCKDSAENDSDGRYPQTLKSLGLIQVVRQQLVGVGVGRAASWKNRDGWVSLTRRLEEELSGRWNNMGKGQDRREKAF